MRIHCLQHVDFENLGVIAFWCEDKDHHISYTRFFEDNFIFPAMETFEVLIIMGGPMGVDDVVRYPWLNEEKDFIHEAIKRDKRVLGICLGAQLIAAVLGAKVYRNVGKEIGWYPIFLSEHARRLQLYAENEDSEMMVFHWHGDVFDLPEGAISLGHSAITICQGFTYGNTVVALQFHLELDEAGVETMYFYGKDELATTSGCHVQHDYHATGRSVFYKNSHCTLNKILCLLMSIQ